MRRAVAATLGALALAACGNTTTTGSDTSASTQPSTVTRTTLTAPDIQPPTTQRTRPGRPPVVYDPCTYIDDQTVRDAGYDPSSRERRDADDLTTQWGCSFTSIRRDLHVRSLNNSFEGIRERFAEYSRALPPINGRDAVLIDDPSLRYICEVILKTEAGLVVVRSDVRPEYIDTDDPCDGIVETATLIEKTIGEEN